MERKGGPRGEGEREKKGGEKKKKEKMKNERDRKKRHLTLRAVRTRFLADLSPPVVLSGSHFLIIPTSAAGVRWRGNSRGNCKVAESSVPRTPYHQPYLERNRRAFSNDDAYARQPPRNTPVPRTGRINPAKSSPPGHNDRPFLPTFGSTFVDPLFFLPLASSLVEITGSGPLEITRP